MEKNEAWKPSIFLLGLDIIGAWLIFLGALDHFAGMGWVPEVLRFPFYGLVMIVAGVALIIPFTVDVIRQVRRARAAADTH